MSEEAVIEIRRIKWTSDSSPEEIEQAKTQEEVKDYGAMLHMFTSYFKVPEKRLEENPEKINRIFGFATKIANLAKSYAELLASKSEITPEIQEAIDDGTISPLTFANNYADLCDFRERLGDEGFTQTVLGDNMVVQKTSLWWVDAPLEVVNTFTWGPAVSR